MQSSSVSPSLGLPRWLVLLGILTALGPLSIDMYLPALTAVEHDLNAPAGSASLTLSSFFIGMAFGQLLYGPISDAWGRKLPLYWGLAIFTVASLGCYWASSIESLVVWRGLQALGACAGGVVARAIVRDRCSPVQAAQAFSLLMLVMGLAPILSPMLGSLLLLWGHWRELFLLLAFAGLLCLFLIYRSLDESQPQHRPLSLRVVFATYSMLLRDRCFMTASLTGGLCMTAMFAYIVGSPFVFIEMHHLSAQHYSLLFGGSALVMIIASQINSQLLKRWEMRQILPWSLWLPLLSMVVLFGSALWPGTPWWLHWSCILLFMAGLGFISPNTAALALEKQSQFAGSASALMGALQFTLAGIGGTAIGWLHTGTALPMASVMLLCLILANACYRLLYCRIG